MLEEDDEIPMLIEADVSSSTADAASKRVPLTIICGFLGAGKSTLLKRILTEKHGYRIAVIMNEFGDTADIEAKAINVSSPNDPSAQSEEFLELANGCLCCSIKDAGLAAIEKLMERKGAFDHILLETTGLADPGPIASMIWHNEEYALGLGKDIALDGVICVVDAVFGKQQMEEDSNSEDDIELGESLRQIAGSDIVLLNKSDLVTPDVLASTEDLIKKVNPGAPIYRTVRGEIDLSKLMGIHAYASAPILDSSESERRLHKSEETHDHVHSADCDHGPDGEQKHSTHYEVRGISSLRVSVPPLAPEAMADLDGWVREVLWEGHLPGNELSSAADALLILRCKGLFVTTTGERYVLQGVRNMYDLFKTEDDGVGVPQEGKLVLIGKGLGDSVRQSLEALFWGSKPASGSSES
ncbi:CobW domain-containing protein [Schizophyllum amplum]|uniref:CobW domain-containing protein n=1 Tax=Schizophyllum amplum TaxID=97359 RepID=A0A550C8G1_9AGAR|nr:CobW domain-containing protein [Auriculariopsis ampla]